MSCEAHLGYFSTSKEMHKEEMAKCRLLPELPSMGKLHGSAQNWMFTPTQIFSKTDHLIFCKLWEWAKKRHPKKGMRWIARRYFRTVNNQKWRFAVNAQSKEKDIILLLKKLSSTKITRYTKIRAEANPYDTEWMPYFEKRETDKMLLTFKGQKAILHLWRRQSKRCPICLNPIDKDTAWSMSERLEGYKAVKYLIHTHCRCREKLFIGTNRLSCAKF